jgi:hypothetical protein
MMPSFGLSSGCMRFEPASLLLWIDERRNVLRPGIERLEALSREVGHSLFDISSPALATKSLRQESDEVRGLAARLRHETDHLRRYLGTSYGLFYHYLNSALPPYFFDWCRATLSKGNHLKFPLLTSAHTVKIRLGRHQEMKQTEEDLAALAWSSTLDLMRLLDGDRCLAPHIVPMMQMFAILHELAAAPGAPHEVCELDLNPDPEDPLMSPFISFGEPFSPQLLGKKLGAKHLFEALAFTSEGSFGLLSGGHSDAWKDSIGMSDYTLITSFWEKFFGRDRAFLKGQIDPGTIDSSLPEKTRDYCWPLEFAAALDLALWVPIGPRGLMSDGRPLRWEDVHPGWRFLRICSHLRSTGRPFVRIPKDLEETDKLYREIQAEWSSLFGWPVLDNLMMQWAEFLKGIIDDGNYSGFFFETGKGHPRFLSSLALIARRIPFPYQVVMNYYDYSDVAAVWFPFIVAKDGEMMYRPKSELWTKLDSGEIRRFAPYVVHHGNRLLVQGKESVAHIPDRHSEMMQRLLGIHAAPFGVPTDALADAISGYLQS